MHLADQEFPQKYKNYISKKISGIAIGIIVLIFLLIVSISLGAVNIPFTDVIYTLIGKTISTKTDIIIWNIRLPQSLTAIAAGGGLAISGVVMQSVLRNPLASPMTLGLSHAAAFGAAFSVMFLKTGIMKSSGLGSIIISNPYTTTLSAFIFCLISTGVVLIISSLRRTSPEVMVLSGVAMGWIFMAATLFLQFFADDIQLASMVFWTFGDTARASWYELGIISIALMFSIAYFFFNGWNYNAIDAGDETAKGLGVNVNRVRIVGMLVASMITSIIVALLGIIGFVGLVCPHMTRRLIGDDHRFLIPGSCIAGSILLISADTTARLLIAPHTLPVAIITSFLGAPVFIYLIVKGYRR
ncbi:iron ABC transporter permease [Candidatus Magnetomorum sp. HK-1]|nr:iron ABC transporter permease [Candidatus Magnetomorum sp. HK-1]